jgi:hypothetical protein
MASETLARKIAELLDAERPAADLSSVRASLETINVRLDKLEAASAQNPPSSADSLHPSQDRFAIAEAIADQIFAGVSKEKACTFEPNGKPCDHCSMCSSRGF